MDNNYLPKHDDLYSEHPAIVRSGVLNCTDTVPQNEIQHSKI
jgi:hypothetical protein